MTNIGSPQGFPQISAPFVDLATGQINQTWLQLLISMFQRTGGPSGGLPAPFTPLVITGSPFVYTASIAGHIWIDQGTYADVRITRYGTVLNSGKITRGIFPMSPTDFIEVTWETLPPTIYFI